MTTTTRPRSHEAEVASGDRAPAADRSFLQWGVSSYLLVTLVVTAAVVVRLGGHLGYVLDDAAIHLSMADHLARDGTWGVTSGSFESASSSPLWTALVAACLTVAPMARDVVPLALNVAAGIAVIWILAANQTVLTPSCRRPADVIAVVVLVTTVLFLPGLAIVGMEHTLHVALVLGAVTVVHRSSQRPVTAGQDRVAYVLVALATLARFESAFVAAGLAAGLLFTDPQRNRRRAVGLVLSAAIPAAGFAVANRALGGGWLPNSVLAKGQATGATSAGNGLGPVDIANRVTHDPVLVALFAVGVVYLALRSGRSARNLVPAWTLVLATAAHAVLADVGWYERYQAYLIAIGVYLVLAVLAEISPELRRRSLAAACVLGVLLGATKADLLVDAPLAADDMYRHQYQAGRFLDRYYGGEPVATDQLGYISLLHDGPLTDFAGLGDYEVLRARTAPGVDIRELWADLSEDRGFRVAVVYDTVALKRVPDTWIPAGRWRIDGKPVSGVTKSLEFFATTPSEVAPLQEHLRDFEDDMPARVRLRLNELAGFKVAQLEADGAR